MSSTNPTQRIDELLQYADWVQGLAWQLVSDAARADDLVQETWLVALRRPPRHADNLRGWLGRVMTHLARSGGRSDGRRARREQASARPEAQPPTDELVAEAALSRELAGAVLELAEPFRSVLLLRYFRDRSPTQIARELERPVATVKTQLQRGLAKLREGMDESYGDRRAWCLALMPLARAGAPAAGLASGLVPIAAAALILTAAWGVMRWLDPPTQPTPVLVAALDEERQPERAEGDAPEAAESERTSADITQPAEADAPIPEVIEAPAARDGYLLRGRIVDLEGEGLAGIELEWNDPGALRWSDAEQTIITGASTWVRMSRERRAELAANPPALKRFAHYRFRRPELAIALIRGVEPPRFRARTGPGGEFELRCPERSYGIETRGTAWGVIGRSSLRDDDGREAWFAVRRRTITGRVVDARGEPCIDLEVEAHASYPAALTPKLKLGRGFSSSGRSVRTDRDGRFRMSDVGLSSRFSLSADRGNGEDVWLQCEPDDEPVFQEEWHVELELSPPHPAPLRVTGRVLLPDGGPAARATVAWGEASTTTDAEGVYVLELQSLDGDLYATRAGLGIAFAPQPGSAWDAPLGEERGPDLRLPEHALALTGRAVTRTGRPVADARVRLSGDRRLRGESYSIEDLAAGRTLGHTTTDAKGRFELDGLLAKDYGLVVTAGDRDQAAGPFAAGTVGIELVVED